MQTSATRGGLMSHCEWGCCVSVRRRQAMLARLGSTARPSETDDVAVVARAQLLSVLCRLLARLPTLSYNDTHHDFPCCQYLFIWGMCLRRPPSATPGSCSAVRPPCDCAMPECFAQGVAGERRRCKYERRMKTTPTGERPNSRCVRALAAASPPTLCTSRI